MKILFHLRSCSEPTNTKCLVCGASESIHAFTFSPVKHVLHVTAGVEYAPCKPLPKFQESQPVAPLKTSPPVARSGSDKDLALIPSHASGPLLPGELTPAPGGVAIIPATSFNPSPISSMGGETGGASSIRAPSRRFSSRHR